MDSLNPSQFSGPLFHGTTHDIQGRDIVPANAGVHHNSMWGTTGHSGQNSNEHAFATENEDTAWSFGSSAGISARFGAMRNRRENEEARRVLGPGSERFTEAETQEPARVRVHTVAPNPLMRTGVYHRDNPAFGNKGDDSRNDLQEWRAPAFRVTGRIDIRPGHQGTFPELNWNQFKHTEANPGSDTNHPEDEEIEQGHEPKWEGKGPIWRAWRDRASRIVDIRNRSTITSPVRVPVVSEDQMDMFSGKTSMEHAESDESPVGDYHRNALFGRL